MRVFYGLSIVFLMFSCSVENNEFNQISEMDATILLDDCIVYQYDFDSKGTIEVRNYHDFIEVTVMGNDKPINWLGLHFAETVNDFPTLRNGDLNIYRFNYSKKLNKNIFEITHTFTFEDLGIETYDEILITAVAMFGSEKERTKFYAGDIDANKGNWSYFKYEVSPFVNYAGTDKVREMNLSEVIALPSWDEVRKVYANMLDPGVNKTDGVYNPSIDELIKDFYDPNRESKIDEYPIIYTLGKGECSDSVKLTVRVVED